MTTAFDLQSNLIVLEATIEGEPKRFLIDTGASASVVGSDTARDLGLEERRRFLGRGAGGDVALGMTRVHSIVVGDSEVRDLTCMIMDLEGIEERIGGRVDGILGYDFLSRFVVTIDYPARAITLVPAGDHTSASEMGFAIDGSVFRHEGFGLRVERPGTEWDFVTETPLPDIPVVLRHPGGGLLSIQLQTLHGLTLESAWPSIEASLPLQVQEFEKLSERRDGPDGLRGIVVDYRGVEDGRAQRYRMYSSMTDGMLLLLIAQSDPDEFPSFEPSFEAIAGSVELEPRGARL